MNLEMTGIINRRDYREMKKNKYQVFVFDFTGQHIVCTECCHVYSAKWTFDRRYNRYGYHH